MDLPESINIALQKNTISYLHKITELAPHTANTLKSYYAFKLHTAQHFTNIHIKKSNNRSQARCPRCCLKLIETQPKYFVKPHRRIKFAEKMENKSNRKPCTRFQLKYLEKNKRRLFGTHFVVKCSFCGKEVVHGFRKPVKKIVVKPPMVKIAKKKKKKDKLCGLSANAVVQAKKVFPDQNKLQNNVILKKRVVKEQKKAKQRLTKILAQAEKPRGRPNGLAQFLMDL